MWINPPLWRYLWFPIQFSILLSIKIFLTILGCIFLIPVAKLDCRDWPSLFSIWKQADGGDPTWWMVRDYHIRLGNIWKYKFKTEWARRYWYCAWRNPVGGWKELFKDPETYETYGNWYQTEMEPEELEETFVTSGIRWRTAGWKDGIRWVKIWPKEKKYKEIWLGWKIGSPVRGLDFSSQVRGFFGRNDYGV